MQEIIKFNIFSILISILKTVVGAFVGAICCFFIAIILMQSFPSAVDFLSGDNGGWSGFGRASTAFAIIVVSIVIGFIGGAIIGFRI